MASSHTCCGRLSIPYVARRESTLADWSDSSSSLVKQPSSGDGLCPLHGDCSPDSTYRGGPEIVRCGMRRAQCSWKYAYQERLQCREAGANDGEIDIDGASVRQYGEHVRNILLD